MIVVLAAVIAVAAAVRSTWSPCGLSMLSTITPLAERGRGRRFGVTAAWFVAGAMVGGLVLGLGAAVLAVAVDLVGLSTTAALGIAAIAALVTAGSDARVFDRQLPFHSRQVNEDWLGTYRAWVYAGGFGGQIGVGLATYIMTAAVYLTIVLAALTASPLTAVGIGLLFGTVRGLAIFLGARITTPEALLNFHRRFDALAEPVRRAVIAVQVVVAAAAATAAWGPAGAAGVTLVVAATVTFRLLAHRTTSNAVLHDRPAAAQTA